MTGSLYRAELSRLVRAPRTRWIVGTLLAAIVASFAIAWQDAAATLAETRAIETKERARWLDQDPKNPHSAAHYGQWLFKPASPLAVLEPGIDPYVGRMMRAEAHHYNDAIFRAAQDRTPLARGGAGTVADILHLVVPLAAVLLGFSAFAADRERGTLRMALGNGTAPARLLASRFAALLTVLGGAVAGATLLLGAAATATLGPEGWSPAVRLPVWVLAEVGYLAVFIALSLLISLVAPTARAALAGSLCLWAVSCVIVPRLATAAIERAAPTPSQQAMLASVEDQTRRFNDAEANARREAALLARYGAQSADDLPIDVVGALGHEREQHDYAAYDRGLAGFNAALDRQDALAGWAGLTSPMIAMQSVSQAVAGTDYASHVAFLENAEAYRRLLVDTMNLDRIANPGADGERYLAGRAVWETVPPFAPPPPPLAATFRSAAVPLGILVLWIVASGAAALVAARGARP